VTGCALTFGGLLLLPATSWTSSGASAAILFTPTRLRPDGAM